MIIFDMYDIIISVISSLITSTNQNLERVTPFSFLSNNIQDVVDQFGAFSVMSLGPVVSSPTLSEDKVVGAEKLPIRTSTNGIHCAGLKVHKNGTWYILSA
jgi:hypothetical protein